MVVEFYQFSTLKIQFLSKFFAFSEGENRVFSFAKKNILLQRTYEWVEYATICAYFYKKPISRLHICINMQFRPQIPGFEVKKKAKTSLKKVKVFLKFCDGSLKLSKTFFQQSLGLFKQSLISYPKIIFLERLHLSKFFAFFPLIQHDVLGDYKDTSKE